jgi:phosphomannomutase
MAESRAAFLDYVPVALAFGTSGLRGLVEDITDLEAYINVKGSLAYLARIGDVRPGNRSRVVLGGDLRPSTDRILRAAARAVTDAGFEVEYAGKLPTPALVLHTLHTRRAGVMVTGSHIPFDRNGIKVNKSQGELLKSDEAGIGEEVARVRAEEYARTAAETAFDARGMLKAPGALPSIDGAAEAAYVRRYVAAFPRAGLKGMRLLFHQHSAVGRDVLPRILEELGAEVVRAGRSETFVPLDTEAITREQLARLEELVAQEEKPGAPFDAVVSTDGDSDRPLVAAVVPREKAGPSGERVRFLPGDLLGIVVAEYLSADAVAVPISANDAVLRRMQERGVFVAQTKIGSPYVVAALDALREGANGNAKRYKQILGWEANGGFLLGCEIHVEGGGALAPLATRDATLPIVANLLAAARRRESLVDHWARLPPRAGRSGLLDHVPTARSRALLALLTPQGGAVEFDAVHDPAGRALAERLAQVFTPALGFGRAVRINTLDGARITFENGDVAHVRPSGNAPQLRIYSNSDTQARADAIVEQGLREPDGLLRSLLRLVEGDPA